MKDVWAELQFLSDRISTQTRTIAISVLALVWLFLAGGDKTPSLPGHPDRETLLLAGALAVGAMFTDYLQYAFGYKASDQVRALAEKAGHATATYDYGAPLYIARTVCFWTKQVVMLISLVFLAVALIRAL